MVAGAWRSRSASIAGAAASHGMPASSLPCWLPHRASFPPATTSVNVGNPCRRILYHLRQNALRAAASLTAPLRHIISCTILWDGHGNYTTRDRFIQDLLLGDGLRIAWRARPPPFHCACYLIMARHRCAGSFLPLPAGCGGCRTENTSTCWRLKQTHGALAARAGGAGTAPEMACSSRRRSRPTTPPHPHHAPHLPPLPAAPPLRRRAGGRRNRRCRGGGLARIAMARQLTSSSPPGGGGRRAGGRRAAEGHGLGGSGNAPPVPTQHLRRNTSRSLRSNPILPHLRWAQTNVAGRVARCHGARRAA